MPGKVILGDEGAVLEVPSSSSLGKSLMAAQTVQAISRNSAGTQLEAVGFDVRILRHVHRLMLLTKGQCPAQPASYSFPTPP